MKTIIFYLKNNGLKPWPFRIWHILCLSVIFWLAMPHLFSALELATGFVDIGIVHVVMLGFCCWLMAVLAAYLLFRHLLHHLAMPSIIQLIHQFKLLTLWEQYLVYLVGYALLLCSAIGALAAIC